MDKTHLLTLAADLKRARAHSQRKITLVLVGVGSVLYLLAFFLGVHPAGVLLTFSQQLKGVGLDGLFPIVIFCLLLMIPAIWIREKKMLAYVHSLFAQPAKDLSEEQKLRKLETAKQEALDALAQEAKKRRDENQILTDTIIQMGQHFHDLAEVSGDLFWTLNTEGRFTFISRTITKLFGYEANEIINRPAIEFLGKNFQHSWTEQDQIAVAELMGGGRVVDYAQQIPHKNGTLKECLLSVAAVEDEHGNLTGFSGSVIILTKERILERALGQRIHLLYGREMSHEDGFLQTTLALDDILKGQLRAVTQETEKAVFALASQIQEVDGKLGEIMAFLTENSASTQNHGTNSRDNIQKDREAIDGLRLFVADIQKRKEAERVRGLTVIQEIRGLGDLVNIVHEIADRTNVLALNAGIIAARSGEHGQQFAVVASEVRKLSRQVKDAAEQIGQGITKASTTIEGLFTKSAEGEVIAKKEEEFLGRTAEKMIHMGENYAKMLDKTESSMAQIAQWNEQLASKVMGLLAEFQFQDITRQQIEQVIKALDRRGAYVEKLKDALQNPDVDFHGLEHFSLDDLRADYVMAGQHAVHTQQTGDDQGEEAAVPMIELF